MAGLPPFGKEGSGTPVFKILVRSLSLISQLMNEIFESYQAIGMKYQLLSSNLDAKS